MLIQGYDGIGNWIEFDVPISAAKLRKARRMWREQQAGADIFHRGASQDEAWAILDKLDVPRKRGLDAIYLARAVMLPPRSIRYAK